jgi:hypothetical protein
MRHIKKFNENKEIFDLEDALSKILEKYPESDVIEMFDDEIINWLDQDWSDDYESEYEWYQDHGNGEAEDVIISKIIDWFENTYGIELASEDRLELYDSIKDTYYF